MRKYQKSKFIAKLWLENNRKRKIYILCIYGDFPIYGDKHEVFPNKLQNG